MTITEPARHRLYEKLEGLLGMDDASTLMAHLPPVGWADVATRADLDQLHDRIRIDLADIRIEMANLETGLRTDMANLETGLRTDMANLETGLRTDMANLRTEVHDDLAQFRDAVRSELSLFRDGVHQDRIAAQRQLVFVVVVALLGLLGTLAVSL